MRRPFRGMGMPVTGNRPVRTTSSATTRGAYSSYGVNGRYTTLSNGHTLNSNPIKRSTAAPFALGAKTEATAARRMGGFLRGRGGLAVGGGALAFGMYEMGKNRSTGRNGIQPSSSGGGMGY